MQTERAMATPGGERATLPSRYMGNFEETVLQSEKIPDSLNI